MPRPPAAGPTPPSERSALLDALRGVALLGIAVVNVEILATPLDEGFAGSRFQSAGDEIVLWLVTALAAGKFYPLFALLFGYGLAMQLRRAESGGGAGLPGYVRRLVVLLALGMLHVALLFWGDILTTYAIVGLALLPLRRAGDRAVLGWALGVWLVGVAILALLGLAVALAGETATPDTSEVVATYADGPFGDVVDQRLADFAVAAPILVLTVWPTTFAMFALGLVLGRRDVLVDPAPHRRLATWVSGIALPLGLATGALAASLDPAGDGPGAGLAIVLLVAGGPVLTLGYVAAAALVPGRRLASSALAPLRAAGRMSLSIYLLQSVVGALVFTSLGLGRFGDVGAMTAVAIAIIGWIGLALLATAWLRVFRFGPFEWLLRSVVYLRPQPVWAVPRHASGRRGL